MPLTSAQPDALARLYASSLFDLVNTRGGHQAIEETAGELEDILELARNDASFAEFLSSRILATSDRSRAIKSIFQNRVSDLTYRFLQVLNEKGRLAHLPSIAAAFDQMFQTAFGRVEVDIYTADPLSQQELEAVRARLADSLAKEPVIHPYIDPSMIGGLRIQIGDRLIDASVSSRLRRLKDQLTTGSASVKSRAGSLLDDDPAQA